MKGTICNFLPPPTLFNRIWKVSLNFQKVNNPFLAEHGIMTGVDPFAMFGSDKYLLNTLLFGESFPHYKPLFSRVEPRPCSLRLSCSQAQ